MTIFVIIGQPSNKQDVLAATIASAFPQNFLNVQPQVWLVAGKGTAQEVSDKLGVSDGSNGSAIIFAINTYFGRANPDIWAWIKEKWEETGG